MFKYLILILVSCEASAQNAQPTEIIYGHKDGLALTMMMYAPSVKSNSKAVINIISGNWKSSYADAILRKDEADIYTKSGYTVFNVIHGSQPRYNITEALQDLKRAVRFIRFNATTLLIKPNSIGIVGGSSGGHLALMVATSGADSAAIVTDDIDRVGDRVQAVGAFYAPTDLLNFGAPGFSPVNNADMLTNFGVSSAFDFKTWDEKKQIYTYATANERIKISKDLSPIYAITSDDPPAILIHGDKDEVVPLQQSETFFEAFKKVNPATELIIKKGAGHGWNSAAEEALVVKWFDKYLK